MRILLALSTVLALVGCSAQKTGDGVASAGSGAASSAATATAEVSNELFAKCMRDNGVDMPDPGADGNFGGTMGKIDRSGPVFQKAFEACKKHLPGGGDLSKLDPKMVDQVRQLTQCLRDNGLDVPDPDPNAPMLGLGAFADLDRNSPAVQKAFEACKDKVPGRPGR